MSVVKLLTAAAGALLILATPVNADPDGAWEDGDGVVVGADEPGGAGSASGATGASGCTTNTGKKVPCTRGGAVWVASQNCYGSPASPQPFMDHPDWGAHSPDEGDLWRCRESLGANMNYFFLPNGAAPLPDPEQLAQEALARIPLVHPKLRMAPQPPLKSYVSLENWLWIPDQQWYSMRETVTAGSTSVTATVTPTHTRWGMGQGNVTQCGGPGRAWVKGMASSAETYCDYTYTEVSGDAGFDLTVAVIYRVNWTCSGACTQASGVLPAISSPEGTANLVVSERQTVVVNP